jgi:hypothetical protein
MAVSNGKQQFNRTFIDLNQLEGSGEIGRYKPEVTGVLVGIEPRGGSYQVKDRRTGQIITRPNSWTAYFEDGSMWSWPTYVDENGQVRPWSRFDPSIDLQLCVRERRVIHVWKDDRNFSHLEVVETNINPLPVMAPAVAPWEQ